jgi:cathepsin E
MNETMNMLYITPAQYEELQPLFFNIGGSSFELTPNAQIWPRALNTAIGGKEDLIYLMIKDMKQGLPGLDFICGMTFIERFYTVFDTTHRRLGLATTPFTNAEVN